jgi:SulP family sulfate permease
LPPQAGLFTAIIAGFIISALGGSSVQIGGPAGAFIVILYGILERHGLANLLIATMLAGGLLLAMGALRLGSLIRYLPLPIVIGFTNGIAVLIALSQLKDFFGLPIAKMPGDFFGQIATLAAHGRQVQVASLLLALASLAAHLFSAAAPWTVGTHAGSHTRHGIGAGAGNHRSGRLQAAG